MKPFVTIDDPITFLFENKASVCDIVEMVTRDGFVTAAGGFQFLHADEDKTWVRGHHLPNSEAVKALKATAAMAEPMALPPGIPGPPPSGPPAALDSYVEMLGGGFGSNFLKGYASKKG